MPTLSASLRKAAIAAAFVLAASLPCWGQITSVANDVATPIEGKGHDYIKALSETVNPSNGSVSLRIQLPVPESRGFTVPFGIAYDSNTEHHLTFTGVDLNGSMAWLNNRGALAEGGWSYTIPQISYNLWEQQHLYLLGQNGSGPGYINYPCLNANYYVFQGMGGGTYPLYLGAQNLDGSRPPNGCNDQYGGGIPVASNVSDDGVWGTLPSFPDGYGGQYVSSWPLTVGDKHGNVYSFQNAVFGIYPAGGGTYPSVALPDTIEDRNGNKFTFTVPTPVIRGVFTAKDTNGRTVISSPVQFGTSGTILVGGQPYTVTWKNATANFTVSSNWVFNGQPQNVWACAGMPAASDTNTVISQITLPNGQSYGFYYGTDNPDPNFQNPYGLLSEVIYPSGAWVKYQWKLSDTMSDVIVYPGSECAAQDAMGYCIAYKPYQDGCAQQYTSPVVATREVGLAGSSTPILTQTFTYSTAWSGATWATKSTTVVTTDNVTGLSSLATYTYTPFSLPSQPFRSSNYSGLVAVEHIIKYYDWGNATTPLRTVVKNWLDQNRLQSEQTTLDNGLSSLKTYSYSGWMPSEVDEYDYGSSTASRKSMTNYQSFSGTPGTIMDRPSQSIVYDGSGNRAAETDYSYDGVTLSQPAGTFDPATRDTNFNSSSIPRGNATQVVRRCFPNCPNPSPTTSYSYDLTGQIVSKTDPRGNTTNYSYADSYTVLSGGQNSAYTPSYATDAFVTKITYPPTNGVSHIEQFKYDYNTSQLTSATDQNNKTTSYLYNDVFARPTLVTYPDTGQTNITYNDAPYNAANNTPSITTTKVIKPGLNMLSTAAMDGMGHVVRTLVTSDPDGMDITDTTYNGFGQVRTTSNPHRSSASSTDGTTTYNYDALGRTISVLKPDGSASSSSYSGNCATVVDEAAHARTSCTDGLGRLVEVDEPGPGATGTPGMATISFTGGSNDTTIDPCNSPNYHCPTQVWNSGFVTVTINGTSYSVSYNLGSSPNSLASSMATYMNTGSLVTATVSGTTGNLIVTARATGAASNYSISTSCTYNSQYFYFCDFSASGPSFLSGGTIGLGSQPPVTRYAYDSQNNLICAVQKGTDTTAFTTCAAAPATWRPRSFAYDSLSRLVTATNPESGTINYAYDADGNVTTKTDARGVITNYTYDALNRLTQKSYQNDPTKPSAVKYGYDGVAGTVNCPPGLTAAYPVGRRTSMCDAAGSESWSYDPMGRVLTDQRATNGITKSAVYTYVPYVDGSLQTLQYPSGNTITFQTGGAERLLSAVDNGNSINYATSAHYAPQGALASLTNGSGTNLLSYTAIFNSRLQPCWIYASTVAALPWGTTACTASATTGNVLDIKYNFNLGTSDNGNVMGITNNRVPSRNQVFTYDALDRITTAGTVNTSGTNCWGEQYTYDAWANLYSLALPSAYAGTCRYETPFNYQITTANRLPSASGFTYDTAGNLQQTGVATYAYNAENQMASATTGSTTKYLYDGDGNRVEKLNSAGSATKLYWYAGSTVLDETDGSGSTSNSSFNEYVYFGGARTARRNSGNVFYYVGDHLGTSREIVQAGQTTPCYDADFYPYGGEMTYTDTCDSAYKFTGKERDPESCAANSCLDNFGARFNSSSFGRFMSPDPDNAGTYEYNPQTWNAYSYVRNNPLMFTDPDGLDCAYLNNAGNGIESVDTHSSAQECTSTGGYWVSGQVNQVSLNANGTYSFGYSGVGPNGTIQSVTYNSYLAPNSPPGERGLSDDPIIFPAVLGIVIGGVQSGFRAGSSMLADLFGTGTRAAIETAARTGGEELVAAGTKAAVRGAIDDAALDGAQKAAVKQVLSHARGGQDVIVQKLADGTIRVIRTTLGGGGGRAEYITDIAADGTRQTVQYGYNAAGDLVHVDSK